MAHFNRPGNSHRPAARPRVEQLEDRSLPSTYWVTNTLDAGGGSLRQAVLDANAHPGADEVRFKPGGRGTITLASELAVTGELAIDGPDGAAGVTVSGGGTTRVFNVAAGAKVTIEDLTVANGKVTGASDGAGILNAGTLKLVDAVVTGNVSARYGGGIENTGILTVKESKLSGNTATAAGGGLHNAGTGVAALDKTTISGNTCVGDGAGLRTETGTTLTVTRSTVKSNVATGYGTGGIASGGTLTVDDSLIAENVSAAAGIYLFAFGTGTATVITDSIICNNGVAGTTGAGAVWSDDFSGLSTVRIEGSRICNNTGSSAGGLYGSGQFDVVDSVLDGNRSTSSFGAGATFLFGTLTLTRSAVTGNSGNTGGLFASDATVVESTVSGNAGVGCGGVYAGQLDLIRSTVSGNTATPVAATYNGFSGAIGTGGVVLSSGRVQNSTVSGNAVIADQMQPYYGYGEATGGVFVITGLGDPTSIENSTIANNRVANAPAGIHPSGGVNVLLIQSQPDSVADVSVRNTIIARNQSGGAPDVAGAFKSGGHNLIGVVTPDATGFVASDLKGTAAHPLDPKLRPLAYNGGPTQTHALAPNSPAINAGDNAAAPETDQTGRRRITGGVIDIGAVEFGSGGAGGGCGDHGSHHHARWVPPRDHHHGHHFHDWIYVG